MALHASTLTLNSGGSLPSLPSHVSPLIPDRYPAMVSRKVQRPLLHRAGSDLVLVFYGYGSRVSFSIQRICYKEIVGTPWYVYSISRFLGLFIRFTILSEWFGLYITILFNAVGAAPFLYLQFTHLFLYLQMLDGHSTLPALTMCSSTLLERSCFQLKTCCASDSPTLYLNLLIFALQTTLTTATCIVEYHSWPELTADKKSNLGGLYIPYLVFGESIDIYYNELCCRS